MMRGMRVRSHHLPVIAWLTLLWVLLWGSIAPLIVVGGVLVSVLVIMVFPFPQLHVAWRVRPLALLYLVARFLFDLAVASVNVSWLAVRPGPAPRSAVIEVPLVSGSELIQTLTADLISLVPGSLMIELDSKGRRLWVHVLDAGTPELIERARHNAKTQELRVLAAIGAPEDLAVCRAEVEGANR